MKSNQTSISTALALLCTLSTAHQSAAMPMPPPAFPGPGESQKNISYGSQYYEYSISGLGKYVDTVEKEDPKLHAIIKPKYEDLRYQRNLAVSLATASVITGATMIYGSMSFAATKSDDGSNSINGYMYTGGILTMILSPGLYYLFKPSHEDFLDFINLNNRSKPENPLRLSLDIKPSSNQFGFSLTQHF